MRVHVCILKARVAATGKELHLSHIQGGPHSLVLTVLSNGFARAMVPVREQAFHLYLPGVCAFPRHSAFLLSHLVTSVTFVSALIKV